MNHPALHRSDRASPASSSRTVFMATGRSSNGSHRGALPGEHFIHGNSFRLAVAQFRYGKFKTPVTLGSWFDDWQVCWWDGWSKHRLYYLVMVSRIRPGRMEP